MKPVKPTAAVPPQNLAALQAVIGTRNARKLCRAFGGSTLYIPKLEGVDRAVTGRSGRMRRTGQQWPSCARPITCPSGRYVGSCPSVRPKIFGANRGDRRLHNRRTAHRIPMKKGVI